MDICVFVREKCTNFAVTSTEETYLGDNIHSKSMKSIFLSRPLGVLVFLFVCIVSMAHTGSRRSEKAVTRHYDGIDVSHHQGIINWKEVGRDKQIRFVYVKATQGTSITDEYYLRNMRGVREQGLRCGSYHFMSSRSSVRAQFRHFRTMMKRCRQDLIPMIDVEREGVKGWSRKQVQDSVALFTRLVKKYYGKKPLIYSQVNFYNSHLAPRFNTYFLFLGKYNSRRPEIKGAGRHNIWQFTERGKVRGIKGHVDLDRFMSGTSLRDIRL